MQLRSLPLVALALLGLAGAPTMSAQTVINSVPYTIATSGKYVLGGNLITASVAQTAITINAPNVILDLDGFFVSGPGGGTASTVAVISVANVSNVTIRNGTVANNGYGIAFTGGSNASNYVVENVNATRCFVAGVNIVGAAPGSLVRNNSISNIGPSTSGSSIPTFGIFTQGGTSIDNNLIANVASSGAGSGYGILAAATDFSVGNRISSCTIGIQMAPGGKYLNNLTSNCSIPFNGGTNATGNN